MARRRHVAVVSRVWKKRPARNSEEEETYTCAPDATEEHLRTCTHTHTHRAADVLGPKPMYAWRLTDGACMKIAVMPRLYEIEHVSRCYGTCNECATRMMPGAAPTPRTELRQPRCGHRTRVEPRVFTLPPLTYRERQIEHLMCALNTRLDVKIPSEIKRARSIGKPGKDP